MRLDTAKLELAMANAKRPISRRDLAEKAGISYNAFALFLARSKRPWATRPTWKKNHIIKTIAKELGVKAEQITVAE